MTDVPAEVLYGRIVGRYVKFLADSADAGNVPDEAPATGTVTLTPLTKITRWAGTTPPRLAIAQVVVARVVNGDLCPPDSDVPGVTVVATDQPEGQPNLIQWSAHYALDGVVTQPSDVVVNVPAGGTVDLALATSVPVAPPEVLVVSHADAIAAAQSAADAEASATKAAFNGLAAICIQVGGAYPAPLPTDYQAIEFRGSVDPATQFTLTGNYAYKWVQLP